MRRGDTEKRLKKIQAEALLAEGPKDAPKVRRSFGAWLRHFGLW